MIPLPDGKILSLFSHLKWEKKKTPEASNL